LSRSRQERFAQRFQWLDTFAKNLIIDLGAGLSTNVVTFLASVEEIVIVTTPELTAMADAYATLKIAHSQNPQAHFALLVNHAQDAREAEFVQRRLQNMAEQFLGCTLGTLGFLTHDEKVKESVRQQIPLVNAFPHATASRQMEAIASRICATESPALPHRGASTLLKEATTAVVSALHLDAKRTRKEQEMEAALWKAHTLVRPCPC
jgi:flagellar biosynthesis protein FlhG